MNISSLGTTNGAELPPGQEDELQGTKVRLQNKKYASSSIDACLWPESHTSKDQNTATQNNTLGPFSHTLRGVGPRGGWLAPRLPCVHVLTARTARSLSTRSASWCSSRPRLRASSRRHGEPLWKAACAASTALSTSSCTAETIERVCHLLLRAQLSENCRVSARCRGRRGGRRLRAKARFPIILMAGGFQVFFFFFIS